MKKKNLLFALAICLIIPALILVGCGGNSSPNNQLPADNNATVEEDTKTWYDMGTYKVAYDGVDYTGNDVYVYVTFKNPTATSKTLARTSFTLDDVGVTYFQHQNQDNSWSNYTTINFEQNDSISVRLCFIGGLEPSLEKTFSLNYMGTKIADVSYNQVTAVTNNEG